MSVTYTSLQNNRSSDANRKSLLGVNSNIVAEVSRATARETYLRENAAETIASSIDSELLPNSTNPVQNKVITQELNKKELATRALETVAYSGKYTDLSDRPTIPEPQVVDVTLSKTSSNSVSNRSVTSEINGKTNTSAIATVATSGSYTDLTDKPDISFTNIPYLPSLYGRMQVYGTYKGTPHTKWDMSGQSQTWSDKIEANLSIGMIRESYTAPGYFWGKVNGTIKISNPLTENTNTFTVNENVSVAHKYGISTGLFEWIYIYDPSTRGWKNTYNYFYLHMDVNTNTFSIRQQYFSNPPTGGSLLTTVVHTVNIVPYFREDINKPVDLFPVSGHSSYFTSSHGTAVRIGQRTNRVKDMDDEKDRANAKISSIYSTIGTLT